jgi:hypothetical protein
MTDYEYLMKAVQDDARRAGERDRLLLEARRARKARRQRLVPAAPARRRTEMGRLVGSENVTLDGVIQDPAGDEGFRAGRWVGLIGNSPQLAKLALDEALAAGAFLLGRRSYEWLAARWPSRSGELADRLNSLPKYVVSATSPGQASGRAPHEQQEAARSRAVPPDLRHPRMGDDVPPGHRARLPTVDLQMARRSFGAVTGI